MVEMMMVEMMMTIDDGDSGDNDGNDCNENTKMCCTKKKRGRITDPGPVPFFCTDSVDAVVTKLTMLDNVTMVVDDGNKVDNV